jgi:hypothetical protein
MTPAREYDHDAILNLRASGLPVGDIASRLRIRIGVVSSTIREARERGDARALAHIEPRKPGTIRTEAPREGIMVIAVATTGRDYGLPKMVPVSLPRLSILAGWTGASG